jgi:hypothetical protein
VSGNGFGIDPYLEQYPTSSDVVGLGLGERKNKALNNFIPIAYSGQISSENN